MKTQTATIEIENVTLEIDYYFNAQSNDDEQDLENMRIEGIRTESGDNIYNLVIDKWIEQIVMAVYCL
jgi:hypothetical protein